MITYETALDKIKGMKLADIIIDTTEYEPYYAFDIGDEGYDAKGTYDGVTTILVDKETGNVEDGNSFVTYMMAFYPEKYDKAQQTNKKLNLRIRE